MKKDISLLDNYLLYQSMLSNDDKFNEIIYNNTSEITELLYSLVENNELNVNEFKKNIIYLFTEMMNNLNKVYYYLDKNNMNDINFKFTKLRETYGYIIPSKKINKVGYEENIIPSIVINDKSELFDLLTCDDISKRKNSVKNIINLIVNGIRLVLSFELAFNEVIYNKNIYNLSKNLLCYTSISKYLDSHNIHDNNDEMILNISYVSNENYEDYSLKETNSLNIDYNFIYDSKIIISDYVFNKNNYSIYLLDEYILNKKLHYALKLFPILKFQYNLDCTRKNIISLYENFINEVSEIESYDLNNKYELLKDIKKLYYELINYELGKSTKKDIDELISIYGKTKIKKLLNEIKDYNLNERHLKIEFYQKKYSSKDNYNFKNNGFVEVKDSGKIIYKNIKNYLSDYNLSSSTLKCFPIFGQYILKDGSRVYVKEFISKYLKDNLNNDDFNFKEYLKSNVLSLDETLLKNVSSTINKEMQVRNSKLDKIISLLEEKTNNNLKDLIYSKKVEK